jgi:3-hydroxyacyl-CoA dehydrogenase/enoyl-CoA hydratase/3-hydroxybutyryl-CoA epimerase
LAENTIRWNRDADGVVTLTLDDPTSSVNVMNEHYRASMRRAVERLNAEKDSITGVIITSAKKTFFAGGDLKHLITIGPDGAEAIFDTIEAIKTNLRALEKLTKPVVAAINGAALGGGLEIALACHHRIAADTEGLVVGLPEVPIGLMPGGGGVTRTVRMFGIRKAFVEILSQGTRFHPAEALEVGLVDEVLPTIEELLPAAKAWIKANPDAHVQPWDAEGFEIPGGIPPSLAASLKKQLGRTSPRREPARQAILDAAVEGAHVDFDTASRIESRYFASLVTGQVAKNMIQAFFLDLRSINSGDSRPAGIAKQPITKIGVVGSGMTGASIAHVSAKAGFDVVLEDDSAPADFTGADFVMKAIDVTREALGETLAVTGLTPGVKRQEDFIGVHFFSPVDKMPLVEIIKGETTSDEALARVFDYTLAIGKTPIVVNDSRGFFTSRVIGTFVNEALAMLGEGVVPASIEQAGSQAGYPAPPLQLSDELNLELMQKITTASRKGVEDEGGTYTPHPAEDVVNKMIEAGRPSRLKGAGFYEYVDGKRTGLWPGLRDTFKSGASAPPPQDMIDRMLFAEALETQKCIDEGVLMTTADANIGSILGIGFPPWTGGSAQFIVGYQGADGTGKEAFVARAKELATRYGERFTPPASLQT